MVSPEEAIAESFRSGDASGLLQGLRDTLNSPGHHHKTASATVISLILSDPTQGVKVALEGVKVALEDPEFPKAPHSSSICHVLLEAIHGSEAQQLVLDQQPVAAALLEAASLSVGCDSSGARILSKLASVFQLGYSSLTDPQIVGGYVVKLLNEKSTLAPAIAMLMLFKGLDENLDKNALIAFMVAEGQEGLAKKWVASLQEAQQVMYVQHCIENDKLKPASKAVRLFRLQGTFPDIEQAYKQQTLARLVAKRLWAVASTIVANDAVLQRLLLMEMVTGGETTLAAEYCHQFGLPPSMLVIDPEQVAAEEQRRVESFLQLEVPLERIIFVDTREKLQEASVHLHAATALGLDVEWKPQHMVVPSLPPSSVSRCMADVAGACRNGDGSDAVPGVGDGIDAAPGANESGGDAAKGSTSGTSSAGQETSTTSPASLLQIGTSDWVFLLDLIALRGDPAAVDECLLPAFSRKSTLKIGFDVSGDLSKLAASYPAVQAFRHLEGVLDLKDMWAVYAQHVRPGLAAKQHGSKQQGVGLTKLALTLLGKPLDKAMQCSDWEMRPLTLRQTIYSAQDAHVLLRLYERFKAILPSVADIVAAKMYTFEASSSGKSKQGGRCREELEQGEHKSNGGGDEGGGAEDSSGGQNSGGRRGSQNKQSRGSSGLQSKPPSQPPPSAGQALDFQAVDNRQAASVASNSTCCAQGAAPLASCQAGSSSTYQVASLIGSPSPSSRGVVCQAGTTATTTAIAPPYHHATVTPADVPPYHQLTCQAGTTTTTTSREAASVAGGFTPSSVGVACQAGIKRQEDAAAGCSSAPSPGGAACLSVYVPPRVVARLHECGLLSCIRLSPPSSVLGPSVEKAVGAAMVLGVSLREVGKSIAFMAQESGAGKQQLQPWLAVVRGDRRLKLCKVAAQIGVPEQKLRIASAEECATIFGYLPGTMPPFGHPTEIGVLIDSALCTALPTAPVSEPLTHPAVTSSLEHIFSPGVAVVKTAAATTAAAADIAATAATTAETASTTTATTAAAATSTTAAAAGPTTATRAATSAVPATVTTEGDSVTTPVPVGAIATAAGIGLDVPPSVTTEGSAVTPYDSAGALGSIGDAPAAQDSLGDVATAAGNGPNASAAVTTDDSTLIRGIAATLDSIGDTPLTLDSIGHDVATAADTGPNTPAAVTTGDATLVGGIAASLDSVGEFDHDAALDSELVDLVAVVPTTGLGAAVDIVEEVVADPAADLAIDLVAEIVADPVIDMVAEIESDYATDYAIDIVAEIVTNRPRRPPVDNVLGLGSAPVPDSDVDFYASISRDHASISQGHASISRDHASISRDRASISQDHASISRGHASISRAQPNAQAPAVDVESETDSAYSAEDALSTGVYLQAEILREPGVNADVGVIPEPAQAGVMQGTDNSNADLDSGVDIFAEISAECPLNRGVDVVAEIVDNPVPSTDGTTASTTTNVAGYNTATTATNIVATTTAATTATTNVAGGTSVTNDTQQGLKEATTATTTTTTTTAPPTTANTTNTAVSITPSTTVAAAAAVSTSAANTPGAASPTDASPGGSLIYNRDGGSVGGGVDGCGVGGGGISGGGFFLGGDGGGGGEGIRGSGGSGGEGSGGSGGGEPIIYTGAGVNSHSPPVLALTLAQLQLLTRGQVADIAEDNGACKKAGGSGHTVSQLVPPSQNGSAGAGSSGACSSGTATAPSQGSAPPPCFLLDGMLRRLCRWLRALGVDAAFVDKGLTREQLLQLVAKASSSGRVFLTRDFKMAARRGCEAVFVLHSNEPKDQLEEVANCFGIRCKQDQLMTRCCVCNAASFRLIAKEDTRGRVSERIFNMVDDFFECGDCLKIFWMGPKSFSAMSMVEGLLSRVSDRPLAAV